MARPAPTSLLAKLLFATLAPTVVVLAAFGLLAHEVARRSFDDELGKRLSAAAVGAALQIQPFLLAAVDPEDDESQSYAAVRKRIEAARAQLGVRRIAVVARDLTGRGDTDGRIALGATAHELTSDALETAKAFGGTPAASPLFVGEDGRGYKRAYAPVGVPDPAGLVVVEARADYFASLASFRRLFVVGGGVGLAVIVLLTSLVARAITRPLGRLARAADAIGRGDLDTAIAVETRDEVGFLAARLDEMRAALRARDERLQMMLAGIAHEVRNPLGGLELYAGLLRDALGGEPDRLEEVRRIEREIGYLKNVVTEFLEYARRPAAELAPTDLRALFEEVAEVAAGGGAPAGVRVELPPEPLAVRADRAQLRRALLNLVRNGVQAAGEGGVVVLAARRDGAAALCEVRDSGPGIPEPLRAKIFDPFFTTREKGTGLGLAFVREIVRDHGGEVTVGEAPEGGACFRFPLEAAPAVS